ncbi:MAG: hypothetical protein V2A54_10690 [Bacteroidota bacterium]
MIITADISYYPLNENFIPPISDFIDRVQAYPEIEVRRNGVSTQLFGEFEDVMKVLKNEIGKSFEFPHSVFAVKIINADCRIHDRK